MAGSFTWALAGGGLIGLSASSLLVLTGRVAGISGIVGGLVEPKQGAIAWRAAFLVGLLAGGAALSRLVPGAVTARASGLPPVAVALAGLLVGFGTQLGGGCTSGHGVCGLSRLSKRSFVAVLSFMSAAALTTFVTHHVVGWRP